MRRFIAAFLLVYISTVAPTVVAEDNNQLVSGTVQEDRSAVVEQISNTALQRLEELKALEAARELEGLKLSDALKETLPEGSLESFNKRYEIELTLAKAIDALPAWLAAGEAWIEKHNLRYAYASAWKVRDTAKYPRDIASALDIYAKGLFAERKFEEGLSVLRAALQTHTTPERRNWLSAAESRFILRVVSQSVDTDGPLPRACLIFSHPLMIEAGMKFDDFVRFKSDRDVAIKNQRNSLCFSGLAYGDKIDVAILEGLKGQDGAKLFADVTRTLEIPDKAARLTFGNGTYILPKVGDETIPLKSINVDQAYLTLFRIPDRGLAPWLRQGSTDQNLNQYAQNNLRSNLGEELWTGSVEIKGSKNTEATTLIPVKDLIEETKPGIYALVAATEDEQKERRWNPQQTQWMLVSDIGLMTLQGLDGMHVFVNSLETSKPIKGVTLQLVAQNNDVLSEVRTDKQGKVSIPAEMLSGKGGNQPFLLSATTEDGDFNFIKLTGPALDLSERGTEGIQHRLELDAFLYTDRGIYRPGETVNLSALLRDTQAAAVANLAVTLKIHRPDGVKALNQIVKGDNLGAYAFKYDLSPAARTGKWQVSFFADDDLARIGYASFQVEDFVPERLTAKLTTPNDHLSVSSPMEAIIKADFLYGAPGANLNGSLAVTLEDDPFPFKDYKGYQFGLAQNDPFEQKLAPHEFVTDETGAATVQLSTQVLPDMTGPIRAKLIAEVRDVGGRPVQDELLLPVRSNRLFIGIKPDQKGRFERNAPATFDVVTLDDEGSQVADRKLKAIWVKEHYHYNWYNLRGRWQYRSSSYDEVVDEQDYVSKAAQPLSIRRELAPGRYRLDMFDEEGNAASSARFTVGWWMASNNPDVPDGLELTLENQALNAGETLSGFVKAPFEGRALITVVSHKLLAHQTVTLKSEGQSFDFKVKDDWGPSAYVLVTALRPNAGAISQLPVRATGLAWFSVNREKRSMKVAFDVPETALPNQPVTIPIKLEGVADKHVRVMVTAVDEGVLAITRYKTPNPETYYLGKRGFAYDMRDIYGRLIRSEEGKRGLVRFGGGFEEMMVSASRKAGEDNQFHPLTRTTKVISLIERDIQFDENGESSVTFNLPDFMGQLRLMAVAYSSDKVGVGAASLTVRTPIVADFITPRFLAPGDQALATLTLQNLSGKDTDLTVTLVPDTSNVSLEFDKLDITMKDSERRDVIVPMIAGTLGDEKFSLIVKSGETEVVKRTYDITVRPAWPYATERVRSGLAAGETKVIQPASLDDFYEGTLRQSISIATRPNLEADRLLKSLSYYAYMCSEQMTSKAFPALFYKELNSLYKLSTSKDVAANTIENAIMILLDRQRSDGSFGIWNSAGRRYGWLDVYVTDFLLRAKEKSYQVPDAALKLSITHLKSLVGQRSRGDLEANAYAHYVLARQGEVSASEARYFATQFGGKLVTPLAKAHIAGALTLLGEETLGEQYFVRAVRSDREYGPIYNGYGSRLRDLAALVTIISETTGNAEHLARLADELEVGMDEKKWLSTQEMAWLSQAAASFAGDDANGARANLDGNSISFTDGFWKKELDDTSSVQSLAVENLGSSLLRVVHSVRGVRKTPPETTSNGFLLNRSYFDLNGKPISTDDFPQHGRFAVLLWGSIKTNAVDDPLIVDLLPAGFEIETTDVSKLKFLKNLTPTDFVDARDDRFVAALRHGTLNMSRGRNSFQVAYIVRAITPGSYVAPGPFVEDMYKPQFRFEGAPRKIEVHAK